MTKKVIIALAVACAVHNSFAMEEKKEQTNAFLALLQKNPQILIFSRRIDETGRVRDLEYIRTAVELQAEWDESNINRDEVSSYLPVIKKSLKSNDCTFHTLPSGKEAVIANLYAGKRYGNIISFFEAKEDAPLATSQTKEAICKDAEELYGYHQTYLFKPWMPLSNQDIPEWYKTCRKFWQK